MPKFSAQLTAITQFNPGIDLSDANMKLANSGTLVLVGHGSILPPGNLSPNPIGGGRLTSKGCIEHLRYQKNSNDLTVVQVDGEIYRDGNINDFRDILTDAALNGKCINFCWNRERSEMTMVNVYPQCCCACDDHRE